MAIYKFKVSFEDYDVTREIDIRSNQTFEDLHLVIHESIGYTPDVPSSFYSSNDQWHKGQEITIHPNEKRKANQVTLMSNSKLLNFIEDPHQKFYYISNFDRPFDFHVELVRILIETDPKLSYPAIIKKYGEAPRQFSSAPVIIPKTEEPLGIAALIAEETEEEDTASSFSIAELGIVEGLDEEDHQSLEGKETLRSSVRGFVSESDDDSGHKINSKSGHKSGSAIDNENDLGEDLNEAEESEEDDFGFGLDPDEDHHGKEDY